ncbi:MAG: CorA family divalent cation transporter [Oscillospiraceae bacterium]|nr:CorA family divalent cation transporter [Clostridiaceae bacterium]MDY5948408.1 CorA family divalent cation transporter [Oscillospiraceae bacterium]
MKIYLLGERLVPKPDLQAPANGEKLIYLMTREEFAADSVVLSHKKAAMISITKDKYCKTELMGTCIFGTVNLPIKKKRVVKEARFGFYIGESELYLIGNISETSPIVGKIKENRFSPELTPSGFLCSLLNSCIDEDIEYLQAIEDELLEIEDCLQDDFDGDFDSRLAPCRKDLMVLHSYYNQLNNLGMEMRSNTNRMLTADDCLAYGNFSERAYRLLSHVDTMRDYMLRIREMYETQLSVRQTKAMNMLTVISAIFLPLTLLAGWYGMNFVYMPELRWRWGYAAAAGLGVIIVIAEIIFFKKKKLL